MSNEWQADLRLKLEDLVDKFVVEGIDQKDILKAINVEVDNLRKAYDRDPDPADDASIVESQRTTGPARADHSHFIKFVRKHCW